MIQRFKHFFKWCNLLVVIATLLAGAAPYASPSYGWILSLFGMAFPLLLLLNLLFVVFWISTKNSYFLFSLICILVCWNAVTGFLGFNTRSPTDTVDLTVMSFNCRAFYDFNNERSTKKPILQLLDDYPVDIICLQEFPLNPKTKQQYIQAIQQTTGLSHLYQPRQHALAIFSKYPMKQQASLDSDQVASGCVFADVLHPQGNIRVYNVHLKSNRVSDDANKVLKDPDLQKKSTWVGAKNILGKIRRAAKVRADQAKRIQQHLAKSPHPVVLCGDINETPQSYTYRLLTQTLNDSFREKGTGRGTTYAGNIPALRIDYILASKHLSIVDYVTVRDKISDHYPIISSINMEK